MPSHPDRVRRNYGPDADWLFEALRSALDAYRASARIPRVINIGKALVYEHESALIDNRRFLEVVPTNGTTFRGVPVNLTEGRTITVR